MPRPFVQSLVFKQLWKKQFGRCFYCNVSLKKFSYDKKNQPSGCTRDHFFPSAGGHGTIGNSVISCYKCNNKKSSEKPNYSECVKFFDLWKQIDHPDLKVCMPENIWKDFAQQLQFIRAYSQFFGLDCP